jgi:hypothetical protein
MIVDVSGDSVRIGIDAPPDVDVHRKEVYEAIKAANPAKRTAGNIGVVSARPVAAPKSWHEEMVSMTPDWASITDHRPVAVIPR